MGQSACLATPSSVVYNDDIAGLVVLEVGRLTEVRVGKDETLDSALRRFKRQVKRSGILTDAKRHEHYEKPSQKRRRRAVRRKRH
jgi:small subunit ribosomal protein S21